METQNSGIVQTILDLPIVMTGSADYYLPGWTAPFVAIFGILVFILTLHLVKLIGRVHGKLAKDHKSVVMVSKFIIWGMPETTPIPRPCGLG